MSVRKMLFSDGCVDVSLVWNTLDYQIDHQAVVLNSADRPLTVQDTVIQPWKSAVLSNVAIPQVDRAIVVRLPGYTPGAGPPLPAELFRSLWGHVSEIFPLPHLKNIALWRSRKEAVEGVEFNLWYAEAGTACGLHRKHDFLEVHTQLYGYGRMQKFLSDSCDTPYDDLFLGPGVTHDPFCRPDRTYPWHQYYADTACLWLAVEFSGFELRRLSIPSVW